MMMTMIIKIMMMTMMLMTMMLCITIEEKTVCISTSYNFKHKTIMYYLYFLIDDLDYIINLKGDNWKSCNNFRESIFSCDNS